MQSDLYYLTGKSRIRRRIESKSLALVTGTAVVVSLLGFGFTMYSNVDIRDLDIIKAMVFDKLNHLYHLLTRGNTNKIVKVLLTTT